jgi:hypothetical protein
MERFFITTGKTNFASSFFSALKLNEVGTFFLSSIGQNATLFTMQKAFKLPFNLSSE